MNQNRFILILLRPSLLSFSLTSLLAGGIFLAGSWSYLSSQHNIFRDYFSGPYGINTLFHKFSAGFNEVLSSSAAYNVLVIAAAITAGLLVYVVLEAIDHMLAEMGEAIDEIEYATADNKQRAERSLGVRIGLRCIIGLLWIAYLLLFLEVLLPFCTKLSQHTLTWPITVAAWVQSLVAFVILFLSIHGHVIFLRLFVLRPRVFGSSLF